MELCAEAMASLKEQHIVLALSGASAQPKKNMLYMRLPRRNYAVWVSTKVNDKELLLKRGCNAL